jgi:Holliday junction resolvase RusA-like endonuclease
MIIFVIKDLPKMPNTLIRKHWAIVTKEKNKWHGLVKLYLRHNVPVAPFKKAKLTLIRFSTRAPDYDGLVGSFKYVVDGLVKAGVIIDDKVSVIGHSQYKWEKCKKLEARIEVTIEPIE